VSTDTPPDLNSCPREVEAELHGLLRHALPRCAMSFVFEITGFTCFVAMLRLQQAAPWLAMGLGALCMWQAHGLMRQVAGTLSQIRQLHDAYPALKARYSSVTAFVHKYARLTGHAPQQ
jgi:hypothetical protein